MLGQSLVPDEGVRGGTTWPWEHLGGGGEG